MAIFCVLNWIELTPGGILPFMAPPWCYSVVLELSFSSSAESNDTVSYVRVGIESQIYLGLPVMEAWA